MEKRRKKRRKERRKKRKKNRSEGRKIRREKIVQGEVTGGKIVKKRRKG